MSELFWQRLDILVATCGVTVDRPRGTAHPRYPEFTYPLDYGYLRDTAAADGGGIDVWLGTAGYGSTHVSGLICNVDLIKRDSEVKLLVDCSPEEMGLVLALHNRGDQSAVLLPRDRRDGYEGS